ncbi:MULTISPECIES: HDOD domain-containing protein [Alishewanella]|jgi:HD-like signal output (HDOD) protein|uniref:Signal transduction protein n=2 Tax=Alishewanella TaxID=111142 RepID=H3Z9X8_9ALTE|nr:MULTISPECIES: HDOD domain-containing protein [Alishewanella]EHR42652.1 signal transduction protein [Alishewanella jeotgali KCTC 22429]EJI85452.1 signal transduction protein [Alishewanella aestuarii B11]OCW98263.1 histidine kinase [Alishewanella sp. HH-ZS]OZB42754.1 MAG: histidine kinase [Alishewanella sp. 34-51-39]
MNALQYAQNVVELFSLPDSYFRVRELMESDTASLDDIAEVILLDPVLTSKLLKLANSAIYRLPYQVDSVSKALLVLGKTQVYNLILSIGISSACSQINCTAIDLERFWEQSVNAALIAKYLATHISLKSADRTYVSGLLHNIGELVVAQQNAEIATECQQYSSEIKPWQLQQRKLGFTYASCGAELLHLWQLPDAIADPVALQHNSQYEARSPEDLIVYLAVRLALANQHPELYSIKTLVDPFLLETLQLTQADLLKAIDFCNTEGLFVLSVLNPRISTIY